MTARKVLVIAFNFPPVATAGVRRTLRYVKYLPHYAWQPIVITADPGSQLNPIHLDSLKEVPEDTVVEYVPFHRKEEQIKRALRKIKLWPQSASKTKPDRSLTPAHPHENAKSSVYNQLREFLFATPDLETGWCGPAMGRSLQLVKAHRPQVVYSSGPPFTGHVVARRVARRTGLPLVLDFRDPWCRTPWGERVAGRLAIQWIQNEERKCIRAANAVILNTEKMADEYTSFYSQESPKKFLTIPNGFDPGATPVGRDSRINGGIHRMVHPGSLYGPRDPRPLISVLTREAADLHLSLEHFGPAVPEYLNTPSMANANCRIQFNPSIPHDQMLRVMSNADSFLIIQPDTKVQIPGKLFEMLPYRTPVLGLVDEEGATADIIRRYGLGAIASPLNRQEISHAIRSIVAHRDEIVGRGHWNAALHDFDGRKLTKRLAELLERSFSDSPRRATHEKSP